MSTSQILYDEHVLEGSGTTVEGKHPKLFLDLLEEELDVNAKDKMLRFAQYLINRLKMMRIKQFTLAIIHESWIGSYPGEKEIFGKKLLLKN